jgi:hypothetical protein
MADDFPSLAICQDLWDREMETTIRNKIREVNRALGREQDE